MTDRIVWRDDLYRSIRDLLDAADAEVSGLAARVPTRQAIDAAQGRIVELSCAAQDAGYATFAGSIFRLRARVVDVAGALEAARQLGKMVYTDVGGDCEEPLVKARDAVDRLLDVYRRDILEPTYELERVDAHDDEAELGAVVIEGAE